jgi:DNA repair exonuclease SbcCD nuclease subunit
MTKLLFFSDMHLDNWSAFSTIDGFGYNTRLLEQLRILETILRYAQEHSCKVIFAGDLFNRRLLVPSDVLYLTSMIISSYKIPIYLLVGNHDMFGGIPAQTVLEVFKHMNHVSVVNSTCQIYAQPDVHITLVPYGEPIPTASTELPESAFQILVTHYGIHEAKLGPSNYRMESDLTVKQIKEFGYTLSLFGHIHKPQALADNVIVLGSAMAHSFHEIDEEKYFYIFDCKEKKLVKYPTNAPKFLVHEVWSEEDFWDINTEDGNYHRINIMTDTVTFNDIKGFVNPNVIVSFTKQAQYKPNEETEEAKGRSTKDEIDDYYDALDTELEKDKLKDLSLSIVEEG